MAKEDRGGLDKTFQAGGRDQGIGPTGPDEEREEASRKGSDMSGAPSPDPRARRGAQPAEEGARIDETPSPNADTPSPRARYNWHDFRRSHRE
jgi:hypothetical protein